METDILAELEKEVDVARKGKDIWALPRILLLEKKLGYESEKLSNFKGSELYKKRIKEAIRYFSALVQKRSSELMKKHNKFYDEQNEKQWHADNQKKLEVLRKEAKRLGL